MNELVPQQEVGGGADTAKLVVAIVLLLGGVVGYYLLGTQNDFVRWGAVAAGVVLAIAVFASSARGRAFWEFFGDSRNELRKVVWPTRQETLTFTFAILIFVTVAGLFFWGLDLFLSWATRWFTGQGG